METVQPLAEMTDGQLCMEIATLRGFTSQTSNADSPYIGWHDASERYYDIRYCSEPEAAWELLEFALLQWPDGAHLYLAFGPKSHLYDSQVIAKASSDTQFLEGYARNSREKVKRAFAESVYDMLRQMKQRGGQFEEVTFLKAAD